MGMGRPRNPNAPIPDTSETIQISSLALLKMLKHGRAGVPIEVMGLMLGEFVDDYTVRVTMASADPLIERRFSARMSEIISEEGWKKAGGWENWIKKPVGTGPYRIASFTIGNRLALERFEGYWGEKAPANNFK